MRHTFRFEDLQIYCQPGFSSDEDKEPASVNVEVDLICTYRGYPPHPFMDSPDPGAPPEWEVEQIRLCNPSMNPIILMESQFTLLFPDGQDILNNAIEDAYQNGILDE